MTHGPQPGMGRRERLDDAAQDELRRLLEEWIVFLLGFLDELDGQLVELGRGPQGRPVPCPGISHKWVRRADRDPHRLEQGPQDGMEVVRLWRICKYVEVSTA